MDHQELAIIGVLKDQLHQSQVEVAKLKLLLVNERNDRNAVFAEQTTELHVQIGYLEEEVRELKEERSGFCGDLAARATEIADLKLRLDGAISTTNHNFMSAEKWKDMAIQQQEWGMEHEHTALLLRNALEALEEYERPQPHRQELTLYYRIIVGALADKELEESIGLSNDEVFSLSKSIQPEWKKGKDVFPEVNSDTPVVVEKIPEPIKENQ